MFHFQTAFNHEEAKEAGRINPSKGIDPEYDSVMEELQGLKKELDDYLNSQKKYFGCKVIVHCICYELEVSRKAPAEEVIFKFMVKEVCRVNHQVAR
jgi:hypothetical protein